MSNQASKSPVRRRIHNIIRRMAEKESYYLNGTPRISNAEIAEVEAVLGVLIQTEWLHGADRHENPHVAYPIDHKAFTERARAAGLLRERG